MDAERSREIRTDHPQSKSKATALIPLGTVQFLGGLVLLGWVIFVGTIPAAMCGVFIAGSGAVVGCAAFVSRYRETIWLNLFRGTLYIVVGCMVLAKAGPAEMALGLLVAAVLFAESNLELASLVLQRSPPRNVRMLLIPYGYVMGILIWSRWPDSAYPLVCFCIAVDVIMNGLTLVRAGLASRSDDTFFWSTLAGAGFPARSESADSASTPSDDGHRAANHTTVG